ncbi:MAG: hypothetical protein U9M90_03935 [Patescibacteria group bacterium]|nr:hypothetical protein [Patescibacteria group bacterium]
MSLTSTEKENVMIESVSIITGIAVIAIICAFLYIKFVKKEKTEKKDRGDRQEQETEGTRIDLEKIAKITFIILLVFSLFALWTATISKDRVLIAIVCVFYGLLLKRCIFRIPKVCMAFPDSFFLGRFLVKKDKSGCQIPIGPTKTEGLRIRWPWHDYIQHSRDLQLYIINNQKYQTKEGSVFIKGIIRFRTTALLTYRADEMTLEERKQILGDKVDNIIIPSLIEKELKEVLGMKEKLTKEISKVLNAPAKVVNPRDPTNTELIEREPLFGKTPAYTEHAFASEILEINVSSIEPPPGVQEARDKISIERLKNEELELFLGKDKMIKETWTKMSDEQRAAVLQLFSGQEIRRDLKTFEVTNATELIKVAMETLFKGKREGGEK